MYLSGLLLTPAAVLALLVSWATYGPPQDEDVPVRENVQVLAPPVFSAPVTSTRPSGQTPPVAVQYGTQAGGSAPFVYYSSREQASPGVQAYKRAETSEQKAEAREHIRLELEQQYDSFMEDREKEITQLEVRIAKLRDQLARRREAKSRMVELKLEMVVSQADGLGWPEQGGGDHRVSGFGGASTPLDAVRFYESFNYHQTPPSIPDAQAPPVAPTNPAEGGRPGGGGSSPR
ncbi:MAG TPA: hypothetical protein PKD54_02650 [Pirellulaceae bacterium]|nr:hypothetical protein [Pirellulaceae bacterium]